MLSQSAAQEPTGLVRVSVEYAVTDANSARINSLFFLDAPPPAFPSVVNREDLQRGALFMLNHTATKSFGQWIVQATYVGAKAVRTGFGGFVNRDDEARVTPPVRFVAGYDLSDDEQPVEFALFDTATIKFVAQTIKRSIAGVYTPWFDLEEIGGDASAFIYRVEYGRITASRPRRRVLRRYPEPIAVLRSFLPVLNTSTSIDSVTNAVIIATTTQAVVFERPQGVTWEDSNNGSNRPAQI